MNVRLCIRLLFHATVRTYTHIDAQAAVYILPAAKRKAPPNL